MWPLCEEKGNTSHEIVPTWIAVPEILGASGKIEESMLIDNGIWDYVQYHDGIYVQKVADETHLLAGLPH